MVFTIQKGWLVLDMIRRIEFIPFSYSSTLILRILRLIGGENRNISRAFNVVQKIIKGRQVSEASYSISILYLPS